MSNSNNNQQLPNKTPISGTAIFESAHIPAFPDLEQRVKQMCDYLSPEEQAIVFRAYEYADYWHQFQSPRATGEAYIYHPVAVAECLAHVHADLVCLAAALLHDVYEDNDDVVTLEDIATTFSPVISNVVDGLTKIGQATARQRRKDHTDHISEVSKLLAKACLSSIACLPIPDTVRGEFLSSAMAIEPQEVSAKEKNELAKQAKLQDKASTTRKLIETITKDPYVMIVKLSDRLHNMHTLQGLRPDKQKRIADETLGFFAPIATRLGIWRFKTELEDLSFRYSFPGTYKIVNNNIERYLAQFSADAQELADQFAEALKKQNVDSTVSLTRRHQYGVFCRRPEFAAPAESPACQQVFALNRDEINIISIVVPTKEVCYQVQGLISMNFNVWPNQSADYIANPKPNRYSALRLVVSTPKNRGVEVEIVCEQDKVVNDYGVLSLFILREKYDRRLNFSRYDSVFRAFHPWLLSLNSSSANENDQDIVDKFKADALETGIYCATPGGDWYDLPSNATPIDFAFRIHSDIGCGCVAAFVNHVYVSLTEYHLQSGDMVVIQHSDTARPSRDWYDCCVTKWAKSCISNWLLNKEPRENNRQHGRRFLEVALMKSQIDKSILENQELLEGAARRFAKSPTFRNSKITSFEDVLVRIGARCIAADNFVDVLKQNMPYDYWATNAQNDLMLSKSRDLSSLIRVEAVEQPGKIVASKCCNPIWGDEIVCFMSKRRGAVVHRGECQTLKPLRLTNPENLLKAQWIPGLESKVCFFKTSLSIVSMLRKKLSMEVLSIFDDNDVDVFEYHFGNNVRAQSTNISVTFNADSVAIVKEIMEKISHISGVQSVRRI